MKRGILAVTMVVLAMLTISCQGYRVTTEVTEVTEEEYEPTTGTIDVYFENAVPEYEYTQIAYIEIVGTEYQPTAELLEELTSEAQDLGADAVMGVKKSYTIRQQSTLWDVLNEEPAEEYVAPVLTGVAIVYTEYCYCVYKK